MFSTSPLKLNFPASCMRMASGNTTFDTTNSPKHPSKEHVATSGAVPTQEQHVAQLNAAAGHPKEQHLTRAQVSQYCMLCWSKLRKQATQPDLNPQGQGTDSAYMETAARAVACAGALPGNHEADSEGGESGEEFPSDERAGRAELASFVATVSAEEQTLVATVSADEQTLVATVSACAEEQTLVVPVSAEEQTLVVPVSAEEQTLVVPVSAEEQILKCTPCL
jgi:hypothetical protein